MYVAISRNFRNFWLRFHGEMKGEMKCTRSKLFREVFKGGLSPRALDTGGLLAYLWPETGLTLDVRMPTMPGELPNLGTKCHRDRKGGTFWVCLLLQFLSPVPETNSSYLWMLKMK